MTNNRLHWIACFSIAFAGLASASPSARAQGLDFEFRCVVLDTPSSSDQASSLPASISEAALGSTIHVEYWATDSGATNTGIISAYADLDYPESLVTCGMVTNSQTFNIFTDGTCDGSVVDELGGSQLNADVGVEPQWVRIASVAFVADISGSTEFVLSPAVSESSAFGVGLIPPENIQYGSCSVVLGTPGACCHFDGTCTNDVFEASCLSGVGYAWHDGMNCSEVACAVVPAVSSWGLAALALLVLSLGTVILLRNSATARGG